MKRKIRIPARKAWVSFLTWTLAVLVSSGLYAADFPVKTITGQVTTTADPMGLPGVNILVKGSTVGTVTDIDGNYSVQVPDQGGTLRYPLLNLNLFCLCFHFILTFRERGTPQILDPG